MEGISGITKSTNYLLSSVLKCPECGGKMSGVKSRYETKKGVKEQQYYVCTTNHNKGKAVCNVNSVKVDMIDNEVLHNLFLFLESIQEPWAIKVIKILQSDDLIYKKELIGKMITRIRVEVNTKRLKSIDFNYDDEFIFRKEGKKK